MSAIDSLHVLSQAARLETEGLAFYLKAAAETVDPRGKALFMSLADDERKHKDMILTQLHAVEGDGMYVLLPNLNVEPIDLGQPLFPPSVADVEKKIGADPTEQEVLFLAMENEIKSYDLYRVEVPKTTGPAQQMYRWLASAEMTHFNLLMSNWEALEARGTWV
ncbi:MAG: ferritin family protein [Chloroflexi bacterium]|nr:ferritin family protein [Chloroflexota bacterium]